MKPSPIHSHHAEFLRSLHAARIEHDRKLRNVARFVAAYAVIGLAASAVAAISYQLILQP